jgi:cytochrome P450
MVSVVLPDVVRDASSLQIALGAFAVTLLTYKLLFPSRAPHEEYAKKHGLKHIKLAKRLPQSHFLWGDVVELSQNASRLYDWMYEKTVEMDEQPWLRRMPLMPDTIMLTTPALIEDVLKTQNDIFGKGEFQRTLFGDITSKSFFVLDGHEWFHQRRIASKFFSPRVFRDIATTLINKHVEALNAVLEKSCVSHEPVNLSKHILEWTLQVAAELAFGVAMNSIGSKQGHPLDHAIEKFFPQVLYRVQTPSWFWKLQRFLNIGSERKYREAASIGSERKYREAASEIHCIAREMVHKSVTQMQAKGPAAEPTNIIELFIQSMQDGEDGTKISPEALRDIAITFVLAGRDTPADTLGWLSLTLSRHPDVEQKLRNELYDKVPELMNGQIPSLTMDQAQTLTYLDAVIKETLRLNPPGPLAMRQAEKDTHLVDGTFVAKGETVSMSPYVVGRLKSVWGDDALEFKPERFIDATTDKPRVVSSFDFLSFHAGPRICIGKHLAMLQLKLLTATLLSRYRLEVLPNDGSYKFSATLPLQNPLLARIHRADPIAK